MAAKKKKAGTRRVVVEKQIWDIECVVCGEWFNTTSAKAIYCSDACKMKAYRERQSGA